MNTEEKVAVPLRLDKSLVEWLREQALKDNRSLNNWVQIKLTELKNKKAK